MGGLGRRRWRRLRRPAEIGAGPPAAAAPQQPEHVLPESPREQRVEERVAQGVDGVEEDEQDLGVRHGDEGHAERRGDGEKGDGGHAHKVCEDEHGHALGDLGVSVAGGVLGVADAEVYARVAVAHHEEGDDVEDEHGHHVELGARAVDVHGQTDAHLAVAAHPHQGEQRHQQGEGPARPHDQGDVAHPQPLIDAHGVGGGVPALQADHSQRVHRQLAGEHRKETGGAAPGPRLPVGGVVVVLVAGVEVHEGDEHQVEAHAEVSHGQVAHEEPGDGHLAAARQQDEENEQVPRHGADGDDPGEAAQESEAQQVLTGVKVIGLRGALHKRVVETVKVQVWIMEADVIEEIDVVGSGLSGEDNRLLIPNLRIVGSKRTETYMTFVLRLHNSVRFLKELSLEKKTKKRSN